MASVARDADGLWHPGVCGTGCRSPLTQRQVFERDGPVSATDLPERSEQYDECGQHALSRPVRKLG